MLQVNKSIVCRDIAYLRHQAKTNIKKYIDERLPEEYEKCLVGLNAITREAWDTAHNTEDKREKVQALSLAKECYSKKLDLLAKATVADEDDKESNQHDYDEDKDQLEIEQEEETGETTNQVF
jgi:hypothetical protein